MRVVLQRVKSAKVRVDGKIVSSIKHGWLVFLGIRVKDTATSARKLTDRIVGLRGFNDEAGKMNRSIRDVEGSILVVSNFTLYANCWTGRRPNFLSAGKPEAAKMSYDVFVTLLRESGIPVKEGIFGADMEVSLVNDGPVTFVIDHDAPDE